MSELKHGKYIGDRKYLYGETALIDKIDKHTIEVQFDDFSKFGPETNEHLALGWHEFPKTDFEIFGESEYIWPIFRVITWVFIVAWVSIAYGMVVLVRSIFG